MDRSCWRMYFSVNCEKLIAPVVSDHLNRASSGFVQRNRMGFLRTWVPEWQIPTHGGGGVLAAFTGGTTS